MRRSTLALSTALAVTLASTGTAALAEAPELPSAEMSTEDRAAIDTIAQGVLAGDTELPALYVGVWDPARGAYLSAYGTADREADRAASIDDTFRVGSISKTFTAAVILQLVDEGKLALDATVAESDADLAERFPVLADLTIEQLLAMKSGVADYMNVPDAVVAGTTEDPTRVWQADELIAFGVGGATSEAGTPGYSTTNYIALQEIAESIEGKSLAELIKERLTDPLGMPGTALPPNDDTTLPEPTAHGYLSTACVEEVEDDSGSAEVGTDTTSWNASYGQGGGGMHSTIADLGIWAASMSGNSLLSDELAQRRLQTDDIGMGSWLYGLGILQWGPTYGHEGEAVGWEGYVAHDPATGASTVVFTNTCSDVLDVMAAMTQLYPPLAEGSGS